VEVARLSVEVLGKPARAIGIFRAFLW